MLKIPSAICQHMIAQARREAPNECCGYLAAKDGVVRELYPLTNADASPEHFSLVPAEQFAALRAARAAGLKLCAVYHSHPATPARPSAEDIRLAHDPSVSYVIVSLAGPAPDIKSFRIRKGEVTPEDIELLPDEPGAGEHGPERH